MPKNKKQAPSGPSSQPSESLRLHAGHWALLLAVFASALFLVQNNVGDFQASVLSTKKAAPFDGTTLPILKSPKWTSLSTAEWDLPYDKIPSDKMGAFPEYNAATLKTPTEQLGWKSEKDLAIRNAKITFSVPYMGNYKLDGMEYGGSHLAVDIKVPMGTPVYAIANGVVVKTSEQDSGFGKHVVIKHENVPSLDNSSKKETLYSSYSHLGEVLVAQDTLVKKGQLIGKSGETGTATTPHVHFQIDNENAPWHPYWPFTSQEASAAGYNFSSAINAGFGKEKGIAASVNPVMYVQKYLNGFSGGTASGSSSSSSTGASSSVTNNPNSSPNYDTSSSDLPPSVFGSSDLSGSAEENPATETDSSETTDELPLTEIVPVTEITPVAAPNPATSFEITHDGSFTVNTPETFTIRALDEDGNLATSYQPQSGVYFDILLGGATLPGKLSEGAFRDGSATFEVTPTANMSLQISARDGNISGESSILKSETISNVVFSDVAPTDPEFKAIVFLKKNDVVGGYPDGTFKPATVVSRVEALKFILKGINSSLIAGNELPFHDASAQEWYSDYVATGYNRDIVKGYPDGTFKPGNTVNRAEFLKMLFVAMDIEVDPQVTRDVYDDVPKDAWFAPYVAYAKEKNLLIPDGKLFHPEDGMSRSEVAEVMYRTILLKLSGARKYSTGLTVSEGEVSQYFS